MLSPGASSPKLKNISENFARNYPSSIEESVSSANFIYKNLDRKNVAIIYVNDEYGIGLATLFKEEFVRVGGEIIMYESYESNQSEFKTLLGKIRYMKPSVIYLAGNLKEMGKFMRQAFELGIKSQIVSNISFLEADCLNVAGKAANGTIVPLPYYNPQDSSYSGAYNFGKLFYEKFEEYPTVAEAVGYDAVKLMIESIEQGGGESSKAAEYLRNLKNYDGALGRLNFSDGEVSIPVVFKKVVNGTTINYIE
jgi:branched-chain amino acid transport system substrate-binding protein